MDGQLSIFDFEEFNPKEQYNTTRAYPCSDCTLWKDTDCSLGIDSRMVFCKHHKSKMVKCNNCFHEYDGKCGCSISEYFNKSVPANGCNCIDYC